MSQDTSPPSNLIKMIGLDLFNVGRLHTILLFCVFFSAIGVVLATHSTRQMAVKRENLLLEKDILDGEWRNLILEESALAEHSRVQSRSVQELNMERPAPDKEVIIKLR
ncbi:cell division protein FtsL [Aliivibrio sp. S3MY1]|uniref:cell division protein FtsL n=1 Tax=unclassified Aliivibrio TaxID=2645654 RepID=UPI0023799842|nr:MULTISPECIES: cell division protein FtsL [unclassified Aliivibrio]MDD9195251.1 cell division protein FtsL [Aliivibrio sp. S3MY1]MDD9197816.1 cell division protein FtsL [Aliivibrio sp. S2MY1]